MNCNDFPRNSIAYSYVETLNAPGGGYGIFTYGVSDAYKIQIGISFRTNIMQTRAYDVETGWTDWEVK